MTRITFQKCASSWRRHDDPRRSTRILESESLDLSISRQIILGAAGRRVLDHGNAPLSLFLSVSRTPLNHHRARKRNSNLYSLAGNKWVRSDVASKNSRRDGEPSRESCRKQRRPKPREKSVVSRCKSPLIVLTKRSVFGESRALLTEAVYGLSGTIAVFANARTRWIDPPLDRREKSVPLRDATRCGGHRTSSLVSRKSWTSKEPASARTTATHNLRSRLRCEVRGARCEA